MMSGPFTLVRDDARCGIPSASTARAGVLGIVLVLVSASFVRAADGMPALTAYEARLAFVDRRQITATITVTTAPPPSGEKLTHTLIRFDHQHIGDLEVLTTAGQPIEYEYRTTGRTHHIAFAAAVREPGKTSLRYVIRYRVEATSDESARIPLPVPALPTRPGERSVHLSVILPEGDVHVGNSFPPFLWSDARHGSLRLTSVPSFIRITHKPAEAVSWSDHILTATTLNDGLILALFGLGTGFWKLRSSWRRE
ncbi:MAG TPA: hypothetical protein VNM72_12900 [Blastocatellia bacterium]|nr:hypothetical protein [Blastocatellia bacterium]